MELYICSNSIVKNFFVGESSSGKTKIDSIKEIQTSSPNVLFFEALKESDENKTLLICFNTLTSFLSSQQILDYLENFSERTEYDVFYLSRYLDVNSKTDLEKWNFNGVEFTRVLSAHGIEGLMISPAGKKKLVGKISPVHGRGFDFALNAKCSQMNNYSCYPHLFNYDTTRCNPTRLQLFRNENLKPPVKNIRNQSMVNFLWFLFVLLVIIIFFNVMLDDVIILENNTDNGKVGVLPYDPLGDLSSYDTL